MVKADARRNYYADLELGQSASTDEIKKQFRTLARLYHPDRNPGKELEYVPKFQSIQAAHEILSDPDQRARYDAERRKLGHGAGAGLRPTSGQTNFNRSPYATYSNFAPPPSRTRPRPAPTAPQNPPYPNTSAYSGQHRRSGNFANPPPNPPNPRGPAPNLPPRAKDEADSRATAWQRMRAQQQERAQQQARQDQARQEQVFSEDERRGRAAHDASQAHTAKPGLGRSNTTRAPKKSGFDPNATDGAEWEPQAKGTSAYSSYASTPRQTPPQPPPGPPPAFNQQRPSPRAKPGFTNVFEGLGSRAGAKSAEDTPFSEGNARLSTPYNSRSGEKTYFDSESLRRSASTHQAAKMGREAGSARHRSASPSGRTRATHGEHLSPSDATHGQTQSRKTSPTPSHPNAFGFASSSESEEEPALPRPKAQPGKSWTANETQGKDNGPSTQNAPEAPTNGNSGNPPMYDTYFKSPLLFPDAATKMKAEGKWKSWTQSWQESAKEKKIPMWAIPSSVTPGKSASSKATGAMPAGAPKPETLRSKFNPFSFPPPQSNADVNQKSRSSDNVSTSFSAHDWAGKFEGSKDFVPPPARKISKSRPSMRASRTPSYQQPNLFGTPANPIDLSNGPANPVDLLRDGYPIPPPPPNPPVNGATFFSPHPPATQTRGAPVKFSSEEWAQTLKEGTLFKNIAPESSRPTSPTKPGANSTRRTKGGRARTKSKSEARPTQASVASASDASDEADAADHNIPSNSTAKAARIDDADAMDIDMESPPVSSVDKGPPQVHVAPNRPELREESSTGIRPASAPSAGIQAATDSVSNAAPSTTMPPPPTKGKKARVTSGGLNLGDLKHVTPLAPSANGLQGMADLSGTLPFDSSASTRPSKGHQPQQLILPPVPKAPAPISIGMRISEDQWREYKANMSWYMGQWYQFEDLVLKHFNTRHQIAAKFGTGMANTNATKLLEQMGEGVDGGLNSYITGLDEDFRVRRLWDIAHQKHADAVKGFEAVKERVKVEGLVKSG
ncbi:hypothetical protein EJ08DRAFT_692391 [Tothia fuscella]|uniref:J domain-containing protein n=1 Tax=Tothia fuscella TaxID=1048955 RepID=A0A9P4U486_9PEZI|nr:hypothetical protein EJ08DRAFT_692391 [Tothia fuscella]